MMRIACTSALALAILGTAQIASAGDDGLTIAKRSGCFACHAIDERMIGPAWNDIAARYAKDSNAKDTLMTSLRKGSRGKWGNVPMPIQGRLSDADASIILDYLLSLGK